MTRKKHTEIEINEEPETEKSEVIVTSETDAELVKGGVDRSPAEVKNEIQAGNTVELETRLRELTEQLALEQDRRLRILAEYDNYRKRTQQEFEQIIKGASLRLIRQLLPVLDDFERLFNHEPAPSDNTNLIQGVEMIYKKLTEILTAEGLQPLQAVGEPFNAEIHEAMAQVEDKSKSEGTIISEIVKGYRLGDRIIRFARVMVSTQSKPGDVDADEGEENA